MYSSVILAASLATLAQAFTQPGAQTWGPLLTPDTSSTVTQGQDFTVTWDPESHPTDGVTVSLVLCNGPGSNCILQDSAIASGLPAAQKSFDWKVPCDLAPGVQSTSTGYGMLIIVDGTGEFQYSTQFSVVASPACGSSGSTTSSATSGTTSTSTVTSSVSTISGKTMPPPAYGSTTKSSPFDWNNTSTMTGSVWSSAGTPSPFSTTTGSFTFNGSVYPVVPETSTTSAATATGLTTIATTATESALSSGSGSAAGASATASGPAASASPFNGGATHMGSSIAGMVIAGAVAVFAF